MSPKRIIQKTVFHFGAQNNNKTIHTAAGFQHYKSEASTKKTISLKNSAVAVNTSALGIPIGVPNSLYNDFRGHPF